MTAPVALQSISRNRNTVPSEECASEAEPQRVSLRQRRVAERKQRASCVCDQAANRTLGYEFRRMQRGDQRANERPAALDHHRSSHHDGCGHRDFEQKPNYKYRH
jgi:hypothetical protein